MRKATYFSQKHGLVYIIEESKCNLIFNTDIVPKRTLIKTHTRTLTHMFIILTYNK